MSHVHINETSPIVDNHSNFGSEEDDELLYTMRQSREGDYRICSQYIMANIGV